MSGNIPGHVTFVGAGPGDPELLTIKGKKALEKAAVVIYAGSLVPQAIVALAQPGAEKHDSSGLTLSQIHALMRDNALAGRQVVRLHTGDPSLYGALSEQMRLLEQDGIPYSIIPGVTAAMAAAACARVSFSLPESVQSLVLTRAGGRTPVPEDVRVLASCGASLAIYLSGALASRLQDDLMEVLPPDTPVICVHRAGWPGERVVSTPLCQLAQSVFENDIIRQTVILVLPGHMRSGANSCLYDENFSHGFRSMGRSEQRVVNGKIDH